MEFPVLEPVSPDCRLLRSFGGYCHRPQAEIGEFYEMQNMSGDQFPLLSTRKPRASLTTAEPGIWNPARSRLQALGELDGLCVLSKGILYYHYGSGLFQKADLGLSDSEPKQLIRFGTNLIVLPDKKYINLWDPEDRGSLEATYAPEEPVDLLLRLCSPDGTVCKAEASVTAPLEPANGQLWLDLSGYELGGSSVLWQYDHALERWEEQLPGCLRLDAPGIGAAFRPGDGIFVRGLEGQSALRGIGERPLQVTAVGTDYVVLEFPAGILELELKALEGLQLQRRMPELDFLFAWENRLWGCRYGLDETGRFVNRIYGSKSGDMKNWFSFSGSDSDSVCLDCSTQGPWTGAICALGQALFFKENCLHRLYGDRPGSFGLRSLDCRGVQQGSHKSLAVVNGLLYYKATEGVVCYDGTLPECISRDLGEVSYHSAAAGALGDRYYISMKDEENTPQLFCYHTRHRLWYREDETAATEFCCVKGVLYYIREGAPLVGILAGTEGTESKVPWFVETGLLEGVDGQQQYLRRISLRLSMETGSSLRCRVQYDSEGIWQDLATLSGRGTGTVTLPLRLRRCDHLRLRLEGEGRVLLHSLLLERSKGGRQEGRSWP